MANLLTRKLELFGPLDDNDKQILDRVISESRQISARQDIIREGDSPDDVHLVLEGCCYRYKLLPNGDRQIFAYLVPGDFCDLNVFILGDGQNKRAIGDKPNAAEVGSLLSFLNPKMNRLDFLFYP